MPTAQEILKQYFGYDSFRPGQDELVQAILSGRDTLGIMPTGAGKSICYQVPALALPGLTLVISPLISLMKDQVGALNEAGVPAACINSALSFEEMRDALYFAGRGEYKLLYVAPERLTAPFFLDFARRVPISMVTVDEAHCISQWGQDFRPSYLKILDFLASLPQRPLVSAFTATATAEVRDDIIRALGLEDPFVITTGFDRPNLYFAGQMTGVEGYVESAGSGLMAGLSMARQIRGLPPIDFTDKTAIGAMGKYISTPNRDFQPMNANFGLMAPLEKRIRSKKERYEAIGQRALDTIETIKHDHMQEESI